MRYISTRGGEAGLSGAQAVVRGLAQDGGLFVPEKFAHLDIEEIKALSGMSYVERAAHILSLFFDEFSYDELRSMAAGAYEDKFESGETAPVRTLNGDTHVLELFHGPTCAFKDMALQLLPLL